MKDAIYHITGRLRDNLFSRMPSSLGTKSSSSVKIETSPYGKLTDSTAPVSLRSSVGLSQNLSRHSTFTPGMDHLGFSHTYDSPPSPRLWGSQVSFCLSLPPFQMYSHSCQHGSLHSFPFPRDILHAKCKHFLVSCWFSFSLSWC